MNCLPKTVTITLILVISLSSLTLQTVRPVTAQETVTPSVPEFTLKVVDYSYDVPPMPTSSIDPETGDPTTTIVPAYHVENKTIEIWIKNQQFTPYESGGKTNYFYHNVSYKWHDENEWQYYTINGMDAEDPPPQFFMQSNSDYSVIELVDWPSSGVVDVRVRALIGNYFTYTDGLGLLFRQYSYSFQGKVSSWSSPQTIYIQTGATPKTPTFPTPTTTATSTESPTSPASTNNPTSTNQISDNQSKAEDSVSMTVFQLVIAALLAVIAVLLILVLRRTRRQ